MSSGQLLLMVSQLDTPVVANMTVATHLLQQEIVTAPTTPTSAADVLCYLAMRLLTMDLLRDMMGEKRQDVLMGSTLLYTTMEIPTIT